VATVTQIQKPAASVAQPIKVRRLRQFDGADRWVVTSFRKIACGAVAAALLACPATAAVANDKDKLLPPGQAKKAEEAAGAPSVPPGQASKAEPAVTGAPFVPPRGQAMKADEATPPGQAKKDDTPVAGDPATPVIAPAAPPRLGVSVAVKPVEGTVRVRGANGGAYVPLAAAGSIPSGAIVDARDGVLVLSTALGRSGRTQSVELTGAVFQVRQPGRGRGMTEFRLRGGRPQGCSRRGASARMASAPRTRRRGSARGLWAKDRGGRFRTRGRTSVASVRGTRWLTKETCAGTLTRVTEGAVAVRDLRRKRTVLVRAGHSYLARARG
jgi:hypothetical protein